MTDITVTYGQVAYETYRSHTNGKSIATGDSIPLWDDLDERIQKAWVVAGAAVSDQVLEDGVTVIDPLRERFENLATGLETAAKSTAPSKKSEIEAGCAQAIRGILATAS